MSDNCLATVAAVPVSTMLVTPDSFYWLKMKQLLSVSIQLQHTKRATDEQPHTENGKGRKKRKIIASSSQEGMALVPSDFISNQIKFTSLLLLPVE